MMQSLFCELLVIFLLCKIFRALQLLHRSLNTMPVVEKVSLIDFPLKCN